MRAALPSLSRAVGGVRMARGLTTSRPAMAAGASAEPIKTPLHDVHVELGGKMVDFAGYALPVQYKDGVIKSHMHTRTDGCASLFDVSHMGQIRWTGKDRNKFLELVTVVDMQALAEASCGHGTLSLVTTERGTIKDDTVISNHGDTVYMVVNGATKHADMKHFDTMLRDFRAKGGDVAFEYLQDRALVALQGPAAMAVLSRHVKIDLSKMNFMTGERMAVDGVDCIVTRCGYTGEDGFEVSMPAGQAAELTRKLLKEPEMLPAGLAARDSLRLEAGLCLYGSDITENETPVEAVLSWTISKRRKQEGGFLGADTVLAQIKGGVARKRVGLVVEGAPARHGVELFSAPPEQGASEAERDAFRKAHLVGVVTSGTMSPCLKKNIAMAYLATPQSKLGSKVWAEVRGRAQEAVVTKMPFVPAKYYRV